VHRNWPTNARICHGATKARKCKQQSASTKSPWDRVYSIV
jgi:hypothetical protein